MQQRQIHSPGSPSEVALGLSGNPVSGGSQCGPALLSILNRRGKVGGTAGALVLLQVYFKEDLDSCDSLQGTPPGPNSQGRGAALGGGGAATEPALEQPRPGPAPGHVRLLSARPLRRRPADGRPTARTSLFVCHPWAGRAPGALKAGSGHACGQARGPTAEEVGAQAGADLAGWSRA